MSSLHQETPQPSTSSLTSTTTTATSSATDNLNEENLERPTELPLLRRGGNNAPIRRGSHTKNGRIAPTSDGGGGARNAILPLRSPRQWQAQPPQSSSPRSWWRRRSVAPADIEDSIAETALSTEAADESVMTSASAVPSPAGTPMSGRSSELANAIKNANAVSGAENNSGTQSKSSSRSGSSRSAFRIFKSGSQSSQNSRAQIVSCAPFSHSPSVTRHPQKQATSSGGVASSNASQCAAMRSKTNASGCIGARGAHVSGVGQRMKLVHVHTLTKQNIVVSVERKCQVWDVFHSCCVHLGIDDDRLFGLALRRPCDGFGGAEDRPRHEYFFLDPEQKVSKYVPKEAKHSSSSGSAVSSPVSKLKGQSRGSASPKPVMVLYMRVRVYVRRIDAISCDIALHHYYLQLRENLIDQWSAGPHSGASEEACWELAALAILTDRGREWRAIMVDCAPLAAFSFRAEQYFPLWVINARGLDYIQENMPKVLRGYGNGVASVASSSLGAGGASTASTSSSSGASPSMINSAIFNETDAMFQFCQEASRGPFALNCHLYGLRRQKTDILNNALIGITDKGIDLWDVSGQGERVLLKSLTWLKMSCLSFDNKRITISGLDGTRLTFHAESESKARYLLAFCREVHQQLIQINTNFALNRPPSSPLLPPGWGLERLIDSPMRASLTRRFNSAEYGVGSGIPPPTFSPRRDSNPPEISSFSNPAINQATLNSNVAKTLSQHNHIIHHQQQQQQYHHHHQQHHHHHHVSDEQNISYNNSNSNCYNSGSSTTTNTFATATINATVTTVTSAKKNAIARDSNETMSRPNSKEIEASALKTEQAPKVRRFKKAGYQRRASSPINAKRLPGGEETCAKWEVPKSFVDKSRVDEKIDQYNSFASSNDASDEISAMGQAVSESLENAMNSVPSPPKLPVASSSSSHTQSGSSSEAFNANVTPKTPPVSCLKRPNSSKQMQLADLTMEAQPNTKHDSDAFNPTTAYMQILNQTTNFHQESNMIPNNQYKPHLAYSQVNPIHNSLNSERIFNNAQTQMSALQGGVPVQTHSVVPALLYAQPTKLRPPPQYSEAIEQLKKRNHLNSNGIVAQNLSRLSLEEASNDLKASPPMIQEQQLHIQSQTNGFVQTSAHSAAQLQTLLKHSDTTGTSATSPYSQYLVPPSVIQQQNDLIQQQQHMAIKPDTLASPPAYVSFESEAPKRNSHNSHHHQRHESSSRWKTVSGGFDTDTLTQLQKNFEQRRQQLADGARKYGSAVEKNNNNAASLSINNFQPALSEPKLNVIKDDGRAKFLKNETVLNNGDNSQSQQLQKYAQTQLAVAPQQRRYASRSPSSGRLDRVKQISSVDANIQNHSASDVPPLTVGQNLRQQAPSMVVVETQVPYQSQLHASAQKILLPTVMQNQTTLNSANQLVAALKNTSPPNYASALESLNTKNPKESFEIESKTQHIKEASISNTEKFKNYPMMKALWEARHDLAANVASPYGNVVARYDSNHTTIIDKLPLTSNGAEGSSAPLPPPYSQYIQQQFQNPVTIAAAKLTANVNTSTPLMTPTVYKNSGTNVNGDVTLLQNRRRSSNGEVKSLSVMDLPPPPPYPQSGGTISQQSSTNRKAMVT